MNATSSRTVRFHEYGEPLDVLRLEQVEVGDPGPAQVRVRVAATGLNPADWEICRGFQAGSLPRGFGFDVAGTVEAIGEGVTGVTIGDLVFGTADVIGQPSGGAADAAILRSWFPVPDGLDPVEAATLPMVVTTAVWTLELLDIRPGTTLLVNGAGGMVGYAAVQVALRSGARVIATAGPALTPDLEGFGALVTDYGPGMVERVRALAGGPVDVALDTVRGRLGQAARGMDDLVDLAGGDPARVMTVSNHAGARAVGARVNLDELRASGAFPSSEILRDWAALAARGEFRLPIAGRFPLEAWRDAVELSLSGAPHGKVVLLP
jgi:NADPH:quinone reductase-like Zn-dependent oxidoreductase